MKNKIILGTVQFGMDYGINNKNGKPSDEELEKILNRAYENNIRFLDTAEAYGDAQKRIGFFHTKKPDRKFNIITKFYVPDFAGDFENHIKKTFQDLKVTSLYAYLFHNLSDLKKNTNIINILVQLKNEGVINKLGVSLYTNQEIDYVLAHFDFVELIQIPFNLFDNLNQREAVFSKMKQKGIEVHTRSTFLQGLFFKKELPDKLKELQVNIKLLHELSKKYALSIAELALNYALVQPSIDKVLIGVDTEKQLISNLKQINRLDEDLIKEINNIDIKNIKLLNPANW